MITAFYTAANGTIQQQKGLDVIANNIANVGTSGFKGSKTAFADLLYTNIRQAQGDSKLKTGHGTKIQKTDVLHTQGAFQSTGRTLDYALTDSGFFAIETADGIKYTRSGNFEITNDNGKFFLTAMQGGFVLDSSGKKIEVKNEDDEHNIGVYEFKNNDGLQIEGGLFFTKTQESGEATATDKVLAKRGYLENSNVDLAQNMVEMIEAQRAFQFNSKIVQMSDEIMQTVNALR